jgi:hypothetical protein
MTLQEAYAKAWIERRGLGAGWIVNLEPTYNLTLGAVGVVQGNDFCPETTLKLRGVTGLQVDSNQHRDVTPWQFQSNDQIKVQIAAEGMSPGASSLPASARCNVTVKFGQGSGASIHGTAMWWNGYADMGAVRACIVDAARKGRLHKGESIVVTQQLTGAGILFTAEGHNASLEAAASVDLAGGTVPPIGSLASKLILVNSSAGAQFQAFADGSVLAVRLLYLGWRGWLWWRDFEAYGAIDTDPDQIEETIMRPVEGDREDEYFAIVMP